MQRPRFSEMLVNRRRQLGLSITQASQVLKLKESVLIAFEEGNFDEMPQSGYAQGMLSSYARYLGLNPREVVDLFQEALYEHKNGSSSHELRRRTRDVQAGRGVDGYEVVNEVGSRPKAYVEHRGLLPTSGGPAGDMGAFATTSGVKTRTPSSVPLAGSRGQAGRSPSYSHAQYVYGRPYNDRSSYEDSRSQSPSNYDVQRAARRQRANAAQQRRSRNVNDPAERLLRDGQNGVEELRQNAERTARRSSRLYRRDDVSTRRVSAGEYTDDLRYDYDARPYDRASTISGRRSSRNIANISRPNVQRRKSASPRRGDVSRRGRRAPVNDNRRTILLIILVLALVLTLILSISVQSCVSTGTSTTTRDTVPVTSTTDSTDSSESTDTSSSTPVTTTTTTDTTSTDTSDTTATDSASTDATATDTTVEKTEVTVTVADGEASWVEITNDGTSEVANTLTGPWSQTYTVTDSITIRVGNPSAVTVTENGEQVSFESKASGLGTVTIEGTPITTDSTDASSTDTTSTDSSSTTSSDSSSSSTTTSSGSTSVDSSSSN
ncbi:MAG: helix-turn-helix domain-containing protein [Tractidigestivibacter sp.]|jgi:cytoskeletal protein RodZ|uniref:helix-turn-helix domain-containing protein n=1 Tax=Tractidigestivibacter sp. TaxID=2847320 RepID=UPI003D8FC198